MPEPKKKQRKTLVAFKVEAELADLLNQLPNKSAFIRAAIGAARRHVSPMPGEGASFSRDS